MGTRLIAVVLLLAGCVGRSPGTNEAPPENTLPARPAPYPIAVSAPAACALDGWIYVCGGWGDRAFGAGDFTAKAFRCKPALNKWERLPDMPDARCFHAAAAAGGRVLVFGGMARGEGRSEEFPEQVLAYDPAKNAWSQIGKMPTPRNRLAAAVIGDKVYVAGGMAAGAGNSAKVEVFNARDTTWATAAPLPAPVHGHGMAAAGGKLVVCGGINTGGTDDLNCWLYDASLDKWTFAPNLPQGRLFAAAVSVAGSVYVMGNRAYGDVPLLCYDSGANKWHVACPASVRAHRTCAVVVDGLVYVIAGEGDDAELSRVSRFDPATGAWVHSD